MTIDFTPPRGLFIDGSWVDDTDTGLDVVNPSTEQVAAPVPQAGVAHVERAVKAARTAFA